ncbi:MAG: hypothetical protein OXD31_07500 [Chloroflexi bacterium]|nr:hypothetical protein [Chloroflexota bacterium]
MEETKKWPIKETSARVLNDNGHLQTERSRKEIPPTNPDILEDAEDSNTVGSSLDHLIGTWTQAEADEMDAALNDFEAVDGIVWTRLTTE